MKVYTKVVIDMKSLETLYEESYEYKGEIAHCGGSSGGVEYAQSPEQREIYGYLAPMAQMMSQRGMAGQPLWEGTPAPDVFNVREGGIPSMRGVLSDVDMYQLPSQDLVQPTKQWWGDVSPDVKEGLWAPYKEAGAQLSEQMGGMGQWGSARGGPSGSAGAAMGTLTAKGAQNVPLQAWQMGQEGRMAGYGAELGRSQRDYGNRLQETMADFGRYGTRYQNKMAEWGGEQQALAAPWGQFMQGIGGTYPNPVVDPGQPDQSGQIIGSILSMIMMAAASSDIRLKKNVTRIGTYKDLDVIEFEYLWGSEKNIGLIAQQVQKVKPEAVGKLSNGYLYINYALV